MNYKTGDMVHVDHPKQPKFKGLYLVIGFDKLSLFLNKIINGVPENKRTVTTLNSPYITKAIQSATSSPTITYYNVDKSKQRY